MTTATESRPPRKAAYLSARQAARRLGVSDKTVRHWVRTGRLPGEESAQGFRIPLDGVERLSAELAAEGRARSAEVADTPHLHDLVRQLQEHVADLRTQLDARTREVSELHTLLAQAQRALPTSTERPLERDSDAAPAEPVQWPPTHKRPWWRFW